MRTSQCLGKQAMDTEEIALRCATNATREAASKFGKAAKTFRPYQCKVCLNWHLSTKPFRGKK